MWWLLDNLIVRTLMLIEDAAWATHKAALKGMWLYGCWTGVPRLSLAALDRYSRILVERYGGPV